MIRWAMQNIGWFLLRVAITLACIFTIHNIAHRDGYYLSYETLFVGAVCLIVGVRFWMPSCKNQ